MLVWSVYALETNGSLRSFVVLTVQATISYHRWTGTQDRDRGDTPELEIEVIRDSRYQHGSSTETGCWWQWTDRILVSVLIAGRCTMSLMMHGKWNNLLHLKLYSKKKINFNFRAAKFRKIHRNFPEMHNLHAHLVKINLKWIINVEIPWVKWVAVNGITIPLPSNIRHNYFTNFPLCIRIYMVLGYYSHLSRVEFTLWIIRSVLEATALHISGTDKWFGCISHIRVTATC